MDITGCKKETQFFSVSLYKHEYYSILFLKWLEQEAHLLDSGGNFLGQRQSNIYIYKRNFLILVGKRDECLYTGALIRQSFLLLPKLLD